MLPAADIMQQLGKLTGEFHDLHPHGSGVDLARYLRARSPYLADYAGVLLSDCGDGSCMILELIRSLPAATNRPPTPAEELEKLLAGRLPGTRPPADSKEELALLLQEAEELLRRLEMPVESDPIRREMSDVRREQVVEELSNNGSVPARGPGSRGGRPDSIEKQISRPPPGVRAPYGMTRRLKRQGEDNPYKGTKL
jgi:hypothetical protein